MFLPFDFFSFFLFQFSVFRHRAMAGGRTSFGEGWVGAMAGLRESRRCGENLVGEIEDCSMINDNHIKSILNLSSNYRCERDRSK